MLTYSPSSGFSLNDVAVPDMIGNGLNVGGQFAAETSDRLRALTAWKWRDVERTFPVFPPAIRTVGIVGAGTMGTAIAEVHLRRGLPVIITDCSGDALIAAERSLSERPCLKRRDAASTDLLFRATTQIADLAGCCLVIETIPEVVAAKQDLYRTVERVLGDEAVLATNTSTIPLVRLTGGLRRPERFCGMHFFHPVQQRPLIEIIRSAQTGEEALARTVAQAKRLQMLPIVVPDGPGFLINRLLFPYLAEALELTCEGAAPEEIEAAAEEFGMTRGPFRLMDEIGLDTVLHGGWILSAAFGERIPHSPLLVAMVKAGRTGRKSGGGFWDYDGEKSPGQDASSACAMADEVQALAVPWVQKRRAFRRDDLQARLLLAMLLEAFRILEEGLVRDHRDIELGVLFGLGFPPRRGGLFAWAEQIGARRIGELLRSWSDLGLRYRPPEIMQDWAVRGRRAYTLEPTPPLTIGYPLTPDGSGLATPH
ncbi:MAG: hypothetical protein JXB10_17895 [Pirellulales bacterium]|nr:hypothetical protein [Pirellulales bacterium]